MASNRSHGVCAPQPAHHTKHLAELAYTFKQCTFRLAQLNNGNTNGTALWMGAQVLSAWLAHTLDNKNRVKHAAGRRPRVLELGSGIGLSALALSSLGWDVLATDLPDVIDSVLAENISRNTSALPPGHGVIQIRALDWTLPVSDWSWDHGAIIASSTVPSTLSAEPRDTPLAPPFDLIITADTVYAPHLVEPLLRTLSHLCTLSAIQTDPKKIRYPPTYVCIERRDPTLVDLFLSEAKREFSITRIPPRKVTEAMERNGLLWAKDDWEGMEIWAFAKTRSATASP